MTLTQKKYYPKEINCLEHVHVLKTNVVHKDEAQSIVQFLQEMKEIELANVDTEDKDKVLRVITKKLTVHDIIAIVEQQGYRCSELEDKPIV